MSGDIAAVTALPVQQTAHGRQVLDAKAMTCEHVLDTGAIPTRW